MKSTLFKKNVHFARHVETSKNLLDIHGCSTECKVTENTEYQLFELIKYIKTHKIKKIVYGATEQCKYTSNLLAKALSMEEHELGLAPINMSEYSGLSQVELRSKNLEISIAMEQFRYRVLPFKKTVLSKICNPKEMSDEITKWSKNISDDLLSDVIYILSSSLIVKLVNFAQGVLPTSNKYLNIGVDTGGVIHLDRWVNPYRQWPFIKHRTLHTNNGSVVLAEYIPKISMHDHITVIVYPGVFGSSRFGPYNLFNRLAHKLSESGVKCVVFDPIGSGESTQIHRTIETERESLNAVIKYYEADKFLAICAHSISANILDKLIKSSHIHKYLLAPLLDVNTIKHEWDVNGESFSRHGLDFSSDLLKDLELTMLGSVESTDYYFGACDRYVDFKKINISLKKKRVHLIENAGHNFSEENSSIELISKVSQAIKEFSWECSR